MSKKDVLLRLPAVLERVGLRRSSVYRLVKLGDFPAPIGLNEHASAWSEREINAWVRGRIAKREAGLVQRREAARRVRAGRDEA